MNSLIKSKKQDTKQLKQFRNLIEISWLSGDPCEVPFHYLELATDKFEEGLVLGTGGFGKVYRSKKLYLHGLLPKGCAGLAIKRLQESIVHTLQVKQTTAADANDASDSTLSLLSIHLPERSKSFLPFGIPISFV